MGGKSSKVKVQPVDIQTQQEQEPIKKKYEDIASFLDEYPPPKPPPNKKQDILKNVDITEADNHAKSVHPEATDSLKDLVEKLVKPFKGSDVLKVRAIFMWIATHNGKHEMPKNVESDSSLGHLKLMADHHLSHSTIFTVMCRIAKIPCVIIEGMAKSAAYEVGDQEIRENTWNAVYVAKGWRLVFPLWAMSAVVGKSTGAWTLVETKGQGVRQKEEESAGVTIATVNDYYFLIDAGELIYRCFPNDERWQLIQMPMSRKKYIGCPYFRPAFFTHQLQMAVKRGGIIQTKEGKCEVSVKPLPGELPVTLSYELFFNHKESDEEIPADVQLDKYVALMNDKDKTTFDMRIPVKGIYKLTVLDSDQEWICFFKIVCDKARLRCEPFPINTELGFGPTQETLEAGMAPQSHHTGVIGIRGRQTIDMRFSLGKKLVIDANLVHNTIPSEELKHHIVQKITGNQLSLQISVPKNGEYALQINAKDRNTDEPSKNVCNYLLSSENPNKKQREYENPLEKKARDTVQAMLTTNDTLALQAALDKFSALDVDDTTNIVQQAQTRIDLLKLLQTLKTAILRENIDLLEAAIKMASESSHRNVLQGKIAEATQILERLRKLKRYTHDVLAMKQSTISEIHRYQVPNPIIFDVMKATFLMLGEKEEYLEYWEYMQTIMRQFGRSSILARLRNLNYDNIDEKTLTKAMNLIMPYDRDAVAAASAGAGTFYNWITNLSSVGIGESSGGGRVDKNKDMEGGPSIQRPLEDQISVGQMGKQASMTSSVPDIVIQTADED